MTTTVERVETAAPGLNVSQVRENFPILARRIHGHRLVYLDSAATSQKPVAVLQAIQNYYSHSNANVHRGVYLLAEEATEMYEGSRASVAAFIHAPHVEEIIFTRNASESINLVAYAWGRQCVGSGEAVLITPEEHHSNFVPWQRLVGEVGGRLELADLTGEGHIDLDCVEQRLGSGRVKLVAVAAVSNVLGTINPIAQICRLAHSKGALVLVDAAQAAPHLPLDVASWDADFVAFTGHKMLGPMGIGVLWARRELLEAMPPFLFGGEMIRKVTETESTWNDLPWKFEAGTPNVEGAVGLRAAIQYLEGLTMEAVRRHEQELVEYALQTLDTVEGITIYGPKSAVARGGVVSFNVDGIHPHDLATILDRQGICVRAGHHCAQPLHDRLGIAATARASFYVYNDVDDVDALCEGIENARRVMGE